MVRRRCLRLVCAIAAAFLLPEPPLPAQTLDAAPPEPAQAEFFEKEIRPLLVARCQKCHSGEEAKGGLKLASRQQVLTGGDSGAAARAGEPESSLLIEAVRYQGDLKMPPAGKLSKAEIELLERWVRQGLPWPDAGASSPGGAGGTAGGEITAEHRAFWSFRPICVSAPPAVANRDWVGTEIDQYILARLESQGLSPAPRADRRTLIRRVTFDLIGLPPIPDEVNAFLADESPQAFARVVDRLLSSPHYGERWGRHWLDVARYADSSGKDENIAFGNAFRYRDFVIDSFNQDKPFSRFVRQQLAGDLLPAANEAERQENLVATGYLQLGPKSLAEQDKPKMLIDIADEQVDTVTRGLLGLSVSCARCHDHKLDPVPSRDYYALLGIFLSTRVMQDLSFVSPWLERPLAPAETLAHVAEFNRNLEATRQKVATADSAARRGTQERWRSELPRLLTCASGLSNIPASETTPERLQLIAEEHAVSVFPLQRGLDRLRGDPAQDAPWLAIWRAVAAIPGDEFADRAPAAIAGALAAQNPGELADFLRNGLREFQPASLAEFAARFDELVRQGEQKPDDLPAGAEPTAEQQQAQKIWQATRAFLYEPEGWFAVPQDARSLFSPDEREALTAAEQEHEALLKLAPPPVPTAMAVEEGPVVDSRIHIRGNHLNEGPQIPRGFLQICSSGAVPAVPADRSGRLELADWIIREDHPLTARVLANRIWQWHFGTGLVRTPDNFGTQGDRPVHGELLDWLANRLIASGWSLKQLHREILLSNTWQSSVHAGQRLADVDPENRLWGRFAPRRLEAEEIRDALLAVTGELDESLGGSLFNYPNRESHVTHYKGPVRYDFARRSIYLPVVRNAMYDLFQLFDHGDALGVNGQRSQTVIAPQALLLLNSDLALQSAGRLASRLLAEAGDDAARISLLFELCYGRPATPRENQRALDRLQRLEPVVTGASSRDTNSRQRLWQAFCQAILGTNEFVYLD